MLYVSILAELIRSRPALAVWAAALLQALLWALVPTLVYWGPPGDVPFVLAAGHEFQFGGFLNPPLAYWLADIAFRITGGSLFGVYALSQACVVATYWAVFALGRSIVGEQHAALAVLLTAAISVFSVPTPDFGPMVLTMPLWAFTLLHYWRAIGEGRREYWIALAVDAGLLLLTSYLGILLLAILAGFTVANQRVRLVLASYEPWAAALAASLCLVPHLWWLRHSGLTLPSVLAGADGPVSIAGHILGGFRLFAGILIAHVGLLALVAIVSGWPRTRHDPGPVIVRPPVKPFARQFVYVFALAPAAAATALTFIIGSPGPLTGIAPLVVLSGLAAIILAGDAIELAHQRRLIFGWFAVLLIPPAMAIAAFLVLPWLGIDMTPMQPAKAMAQFFGDSFQRRVGAPLSIVTGDPRIAAMVSLAPSRPHLYLDATPQRSPWVTADDVKTKGAIVVWPNSGIAGAPPPDIAARFPGLVPEVPHTFERPVQGALPLLRIGWALIRPQSDPGVAKADEKKRDEKPSGNLFSDPLARSAPPRQAQ